MSAANSSAPIYAAVITASASLVALLSTAIFARRAISRARRMDKLDNARRYREPLLHAAFNLQSRIWNMFGQHFLDDFLTSGTSREQQYARLNTAYLVAQYLYWAELIRQEAQYLAPTSRYREKKLIAAMERIRFHLADSQSLGSQPFRVFRGDQRAIGEVMVAENVDHTQPEHSCRGYADFVSTLSTSRAFASWIQPLLDDVDRVALDLTANGARLRELQHSLVALVDLIDSRGRSVPKNERSLI